MVGKLMAKSQTTENLWLKILTLGTLLENSVGKKSDGKDIT